MSEKDHKLQRIENNAVKVLIFVLVLYIFGRILWMVRNPKTVQASEETVPSQSEEEDSQARAASLLQEMSLQDKVCQLFIVTPEALSGGTDDTVLSYEMQTGLAQYPVGGVILFGKNIVDRNQTIALLNGLQDAAKVKLFTAVDEEGGSVSRIGANSNMEAASFPNMLRVGTSGDLTYTKDVGYLIGTDLKQLGFNLDFAPVADVYSNASNTVIGKRAFSSDPQEAAEMVKACVEGFQESGILCTLKHFPGHGDTSADSHTGTAIVNKSLDELMNCELIPFAAGIEAGAPVVMVGHITCTTLDPEKPASLSPNVVTDLLRGKMGYQGLIVTDSLQMTAATECQVDGRCAALQALEAGCDLLLMPDDLSEAVGQIMAAVQSGEIPESRIDESVQRILTVKLQNKIIA